MKSWIVFLCVSISLMACSDYNEILKGDDQKAKFTLANELLEKGTYDKCIVLYEQVYQNAPKSVEGELSYFNMAKSYYLDEDYYMAGYFFGSFVQRYPYSLRNEESFFLTAMCSVNNSPKWSLDQTETYAALNAVQAFIDKYPNSPLIDSCNTIIDELSYKLEFKDFNKVLLYGKTENYKAAVSFAEIFLEKYPLSIHDEEVRFTSIKNGYYLSINSIDSKKKVRMEETLDRYRNFVADYPQSVFINELKSLLSAWENDYEF
jgi:outer membrane protein assembly factor BamD